MDSSTASISKTVHSFTKQTDLGSMEGSLAAVDGRAYIGTEHGDLFCLDMSDGSTIWRARIGADSDSTPAVANGFVYTAAENGDVYCFRQSNGELVWKYQATGGTTKDRAGILGQPDRCKQSSLHRLEQRPHVCVGGRYW